MDDNIVRTGLVGLVCVILGTGSVVAAGCDLTAPMVATSCAQWASDVRRSDLIGKTFTGEKIASVWRPQRKGGYIAYLLAVEDERFVGFRMLDEQTDWVESFSANDPEKTSKILWSRRDPRMEAHDRLTPGLISDTGPFITSTLNQPARAEL